MKINIRNYIFLIFIFLFTPLITQGVQTDILSFHCNEAIIEGITTRVEFTANLRIKTDNLRDNQYVDFNNLQGQLKNNFIKCENIQILGKSSNIISFQKDKNNNIKDTLEFRIKGNLIFYWSKYKNNYSKVIRLGKIYTKINQERKEIGVIEIILDNLNIVSLLKVNIKNHMDFGTIIAGQKVDTREAGRTPARIEVEGASRKKVKIVIPQTTKIENNRGDILTVDLNFREREKSKQEGAKKSIVKNILNETSKRGVGKTDTIEIDGSIITKRQSLGNYKGVFTVRVEYEN